MPVPLRTMEWPDSELVLGLVAPVGTDLNVVVDRIKKHVEGFDYRTVPIKLSRLLDRIKPKSLAGC